MRKLMPLLLVILIAGWCRAQTPERVPIGWSPGEPGPIYLRVGLDSHAPLPVYLEGTVGWNWPRPAFGFFAAATGHTEAKLHWSGRHILPDAAGTSFQPTGETCLQPGSYSPWIEIPKNVLGGGWANRLTLKYPQTLLQTNITVSLAIASRPDPKAIVANKTFTIGVSQPTTTLLLNRWLQGEAARSYTELADETHQLANERLKEPVFGKPPEKFPCLTTMGLDRTLYPEVSKTELSTLKMLGMNGLWVQFGPDLQQAGFVHNEVAAFLNGTLEAWGWFPTNGQAEAWVKANAARVDQANAWGNVGALHTIEEIGTPPLSTFIRETPKEKLPWGATRHSLAFYRERFIDYLKEQKITPQQLGKTDWEQIRIVDRDEADTEPFLFYHSARFRTWTLANIIRDLDRYYPKYLKKPLYTINMTSDAFMGTGSMTAHGVDLLHSIRLAPSVKDMGIEAWKNLTATYQFVSWEMEMIRCGTRYKTNPGLQLCAIMSRPPLDLEFSVYSSLAHGMNYLSYFSYGPWYHGGDHASEKDENFPVIRRMNYAIGGIEDLLLESQMRPAEVAILYAMPTDVWTWARYGRNTAWLSEHIGVFLALQNAQIPVEILADEDVESGELAKYRVLYVVGPNITAAAAKAIAKWVQGGGTLVGTAAAGSRDEFDRPLTTLEPVFGARQGEAHFATVPGYTYQLDQLPLLDNVITRTDHHATAGTRVTLTPVDEKTKILGRFASDDLPAIIQRSVGKGTAQLFASLPGLTYLREGVAEKRRNDGFYADCYSPSVFPKTLSDAISAPALTAGVRRPVEVAVPGVEVGLREGTNGAVVVLVNYPRQDQKDLKLTVRDIQPDRIRSVTATTLGHAINFNKLNATDIEIVLPKLTTTEMIAIRY